MTDRDRLHLHQEIMLLALRDRKGTMLGAHPTFGLAGAMLAELLLLGRLEVQEERDKKFVVIGSDVRTGDPALDNCLDRISAARRRATMQTWVTRLTSIKHLKHIVAQELCRRGVLRADEAKVLLLFRRKVYPELDPRPERELVERLRNAIFLDGTKVDPRTAILTSLAHHAGVLSNVFPKKELAPRKRRIEAIVEGEATAASTKDAIEAAEAAQVAILAATIAATTAVTISHH